MINKRLGKRLLSVLSALCLVVNTYGGTVLAAEAQPVRQTVNVSDDNSQNDSVPNADQTQTEPSGQEEENQGETDGENRPDHLGGGVMTMI